MSEINLKLGRGKAKKQSPLRKKTAPEEQEASEDLKSSSILKSVNAPLSLLESFGELEILSQGFVNIVKYDNCLDADFALTQLRKVGY